MTWTFPRAGKQYGAYARVPICRACGNPFVPPGFDGCCSVRCVQYLAVARQPVLGDPLFGPQQPMMCRGCGLRFESRGIVLCPDCWDRSRSNEAEAGVGVGAGLAAPEVTPVTPTAVRHEAPISERDPRSKFCHW
jgi:hypothetical protein